MTVVTHRGRRLAVLLAVVLVAAAIGSAVASATYAHTRAEAAAQAAERHRTQARALESAPPPGWVSDGGPAHYPVTVAWPGPSGGTRTALVLVPAGTPTGAHVTVWLDGDGRSRGEPLNAAEIAARAVGHGLLAAAAVCLVALAAWAAVRAFRGRARGRRWAEEWAVVEPAWTRHFS